MPHEDASPRWTARTIAAQALGAVALVLLLGLINLMRGGSPHLSQRLMRLRVLMQFIAIIVIMLTILIMHH